MTKQEELKIFFNKKYEEFHLMVYAYIFSRVNDKEIAKDLVQETFIRVWKKINLLSELSLNNCRYWVFRTAKNIVTDHYRKRSYQDRIVKEIQNQASIEKKTPEEELQIQEDLNELSDAIHQLSEELRTPLLLQVMAHMNSNQISEVLDVPAGTIRYRISVARQRLLAILKMNNNRMAEEEFK